MKALYSFVCAAVLFTAGVLMYAIVSSCSRLSAEPATLPPPSSIYHDTQCVYTLSTFNLYRCESDEVVCYGANQDGFTCKWKDMR